MARTIEQIQQSIIDAKNADATLAGLNSTSRVAIWLLWTWVIATAMWVQENLFDAHKSEVQQIIASQKPHRLQWYVTMARQFQYGYASAQIVAFAAAVEVLPFVRIKVAKLAGGVLAQLAAGELTAFTNYMNRVKDAGVPLQCTSAAGDSLRVGLQVFYDPLILDATGRRLDGSNDTPVLLAINNYIDALPFNGVFILNGLIAAIGAVEGVSIGDVLYCAAAYGALPYSLIAAAYTPDAGYLVVDTVYFNANVIYTPYAV